MHRIIWFTALSCMCKRELINDLDTPLLENREWKISILPVLCHFAAQWSFWTRPSKFAQTRMPCLSTRRLSYYHSLNGFSSRLSEFFLDLLLGQFLFPNRCFDQTSLCSFSVQSEREQDIFDAKRKRARQVRWFFIKAIQHWTKAAYWKHPVSVVSWGEIHSFMEECLYGFYPACAHAALTWSTNTLLRC